MNGHDLKSAAVIGAGSWGTTIADHLGRNGVDVMLWAHEPEVAADIRATRENSLFLPGFKLSPRLTPTNDLEEAARGRQLLVCAVPSHVARRVLEALKPFLAQPVPIISATKGVEVETLLLPTQVMASVLGSAWQTYIGVLSGPSFAREVALGLPTAVALALGDRFSARQVQSAFSSATFRVYTNEDAVGLQIGGAVKNVIAVAAGICDGLEFGNNARAALITRGLAEMKRLGLSMGARAATFAGLSGLGDLVLTCTGDLSRNRTLGLQLGRGASLAEILASSRMVAEGVHTSEAMAALAARQGIDMPICRQTHAIIHQGKKPLEAFRELMARDLKDEHEELAP